MKQSNWHIGTLAGCFAIGSEAVCPSYAGTYCKQVIEDHFMEKLVAASNDLTASPDSRT